MNPSVLEAKKAKVAEISKMVKESGSVIVVEYRGLSVSELSLLKRDLLKENAKMSVYKNKLVVKANEELGYVDLNQYLVGPNAFIYAQDEISGAKVAAKFAKKHDNLVIKAGVVDGKVIDEKGVKTLAQLPNKEGMLSMLLSVLQAPVRNFACAVKAVAEKE